MLLALASAQTKNSAAQELLRQQERERILREKQETATDVQLQSAQAPPPDRLPPEETPCFPIERVWLDGEDAHRFLWSLKAADPGNDLATGRCLGTDGINMVMARVQNAVVVRGFVTTHIREPAGWKLACEGKDHISHQAWNIFYNYTAAAPFHTWVPGEQEMQWLSEKYPDSFDKHYRPRLEHYRAEQQAGKRFYSKTLASMSGWPLWSGDR